MKRMMNFILLIIASLSLAACGSGDSKDQEGAAEVVKQFEQTQSSVTYQDPASFAKGDPYLTPEFAKKYHEEVRGGMEKFLQESKGTVSGSKPEITFVKKEGESLVYELKADRTIAIEIPKQSIQTQVHYLVTVTKQEDGAFLISNMEEQAG